MNRRAAREPLFFDDNDRFTFLELLEGNASRTEVEVHAYCLMGNHFHLLLRTPNANLGYMMQLLLGRYARYFNDRYGRDGGVCRGRYRSVLVDSDRYLLAVSRYIHRNPLAFWGGPLESYSWSSYPKYLGLRRGQDWIQTEMTLDVVGGAASYRGLVESPLPSDVDEIYGSGRVPKVLGGRSFEESVRQGV